MTARFKTIKVQTTVTLTIPSDATHYMGDLGDSPTFTKVIKLGDYSHWLHYSDGERRWIFLGYDLDSCMTPLNPL
jgi:hypothetical protein